MSVDNISPTKNRTNILKLLTGRRFSHDGTLRTLSPMNSMKTEQDREKMAERICEILRKNLSEEETVKAVAELEAGLIPEIKQ